MIMICLVLFLADPSSPQNLDVKGLLSGWGTLNADHISEPQFGLYYIPEFLI